VRGKRKEGNEGREGEMRGREGEREGGLEGRRGREEGRKEDDGREERRGWGTNSCAILEDD